MPTSIDEVRVLLPSEREARLTLEGRSFYMEPSPIGNVYDNVGVDLYPPVPAFCVFEKGRLNPGGHPLLIWGNLTKEEATEWITRLNAGDVEFGLSIRLDLYNTVPGPEAPTKKSAPAKPKPESKKSTPVMAGDRPRLEDLFL